VKQLQNISWSAFPELFSRSGASGCYIYPTICCVCFQSTTMVDVCFVPELIDNIFIVRAWSPWSNPVSFTSQILLFENFAERVHSFHFTKLAHKTFLLHFLLYKRYSLLNTLVYFFNIMEPSTLWFKLVCTYIQVLP
jgi:hypothetical protein